MVKQINTKKIISIETFSYEYNELKQGGLLPYQIKDKLEEKYDCKDTTYYIALREGRERGLIEDSYLTNVKAANTRRRGIKRHGNTKPRRIRKKSTKPRPRPVKKSNVDWDCIMETLDSGVGLVERKEAVKPSIFTIILAFLKGIFHK